jgi:cyclically-permuted mutarotase family protein
MSIFSRTILAMFAFCGALAVAQTRVVDFAWDELPPLPPPAGQQRQPGVAGPFVGVHGDILIVAGGANFPDKMPWDGGTKTWWDGIWVLERSRDGAAHWVTEKQFKLPRKMGYGMSVSTPEGVVCVGGSDADRCYADAFLLSWDARTRQIRTTSLPPMPEPLSFMGGALVGSTLYVAGGQHAMKGATPSSAFWALDLANRDRTGALKWTVLPTWPGPPRVLPVAAAQRASSRNHEFFLFGGRRPRVGEPTEMLSDAYAFDPGTGQWRTLAKVGGGEGISVMAGTAAPLGDEEVLIFGGDRGEFFLELEAHDLAIDALRTELSTAPSGSRAAIERQIEQRLAAKRKIYATHPGFGREVLAYDTRHDRWRVITRSPIPPQVTTLAVKWGDEVIIPSGEIRPGVRTPSVIRATPVSK